MDPRQILLQRPMGRMQVIAIAICVAINAIDGFDILAVTFAAPGIAADWRLMPTALGIVISTGLMGMAAGSLFLAPLADVIGRRKVIICSLLLMTAGMLLTSMAGDVYALSAYRLITGVGIGAMLGSLTAIVTEYANERRRHLVVGLMSIGNPIGGVVGGAVAAYLMSKSSWHSVFLFGGCATALMLVPVLVALPESIEFICTMARDDALPRVNRILRQMGHPEATVIEGAQQRTSTARVVGIFSTEVIRFTASLTVAYCLFNMTFYYIIGWVPAIVASLGFDKSVATSVSVMLNLGGIVGGIALGWLANRYGLKSAVLAAMVCTTISLLLFGSLPPDIDILRAGAFVVGLFLFGGVVGIFAACAQVFRPNIRASGTGFVIGVGRAGAILGPIVTGVLMSMEISRFGVAGVMGTGALLAALVLAIGLRFPRTTSPAFSP